MEPEAPPACIFTLCRRMYDSTEVTQDEADAVLRALQDPRADWEHEQYLWLEDLFLYSERRQRVVPVAAHVLRNLHKLTALCEADWENVISFSVVRFCTAFGMMDELRILLDYTAAHRLPLKFARFSTGVPGDMDMLRLALSYPHVTGFNAGNTGFGIAHWCAKHGHAAELRAILARPRGSPSNYDLLWMAAQHGHLECMEVLLQDGRVSGIDRMEALRVATANDYTDELTLLAAHGVEGAAEAAAWSRRRAFFNWHCLPNARKPAAAKYRVLGYPNRLALLEILEADGRFGVAHDTSSELLGPPSSPPEAYRMMNVVAGAVARFL